MGRIGCLANLASPARVSRAQRDDDAQRKSAGQQSAPITYLGAIVPASLQEMVALYVLPASAVGSRIRPRPATRRSRPNRSSSDTRLRALLRKLLPGMMRLVA